jgi:F-type H+-transporting ATPase subunit gamma
VLFIVFGSDKGLCGSFNSKITIYITSELQVNKNAKIFCVGNKISQYMQAHHKENIEKSMPFFRKNNKKISYNASALLSREIRNAFLNGKFSECRIVYTKFESVLHQQVEDIKLLPLQIDEIENLSCFSKSDKEIFEFDNNLETILEKLIQNYINATVLYACSNSLTCEHSARMLAMDSATKNSDKMLKELNLLYNRSRQAIITKELIEIISGAEATN